MRKLAMRIEKRITSWYQFCNNMAYYYLTCGYSLRKSLQLARDTLP